MQNPLPHNISGQQLWLFPERCLYWEEEKTLVIADLHLGKTGHFRKAGIAVPQSVYKADLQRLVAMLYLCKAERLIIVGDFTHSSLNREMELFLKWRNDFSSLYIDLVKGNHDILDDSWYTDASIRVHECELLAGPFLFRHENNKEVVKRPDGVYTFTGHVHPGYVLKGQGKQSLRFPCFYFSKTHCILPAFSRFTGMFQVKPAKGETVYALTPTGIIKVG